MEEKNMYVTVFGIIAVVLVALIALVIINKNK